MKQLFGCNRPHDYGSTVDERIERMTANAPMWVLGVAWVLFAGCLGVAGYSEWVVARPVMSVIFAHPAEAVATHNLPIVIYMLAVVGAVTLTARQSGWLLMRTSNAIWQQKKLVRCEF